MNPELQNNIIKIRNNIANLVLENKKNNSKLKSSDSGLDDNNNNEDVYIVHNNTIGLLSYESLKTSIATICKLMNVEHLDVDKLSKNVLPKLKTKNTLEEIEDQIINSATEMICDHYDYPSIAVWIIIDKLHRSTCDDYLDLVRLMRSNVNKKGKLAPIISESFANYVEKHHQKINNAIRYERDYQMSIFGYRTLENAYLKKLSNGNIIERPQHMFMRVAIALHYKTDRIDRIIETYEQLSRGYFTHATPTLFNAGTTHEQLSSCFLLGIDDDMEAIGECWKACAVISKYAGGIAVHVSNLRCFGSYINSTQGRASGLRVLPVFGKISHYADQGGKRPGSIAIYLEPWHADIFFFLDLKKNTGAETERARDLFLGLMINDIFMQRVESDGIWSLMCPSECPNILDKFGTEFTQAYLEYESSGKYIKQISARELWFKIMESQIESGVPYIIFKDAANYKSNQQNIGVINGSNLCVSGDTMILTSNGYFNIKSLENHQTEIWNGEEFSKVQIKKTGQNQELVEISFSNGSVLKCTPYHKFYINSNNEIIEKKASELVIKDQLIDYTLPIIENGSDNFDYLKEYNVPINNNIKIKLKWLGDILDRYAYKFPNFQLPNISLKIRADDCIIPSANRNFLIDLQYMFQTLGCHTRIVKFSDSDKYNIIISEKQLNNLEKFGLECKKIDFYKGMSDDNSDFLSAVYITNITKLDKKEDTYCFSEPKRHMGIFNGVITGQCSEILEVSDANHYSTCNLASICLPKYVIYQNGQPIFDYEELRRNAQIVTRNLNNIIDINFYPIEKTRATNLRDRPIGIGAQGLADVFAIFKTPFDSDLARDLNKKIFETIYFGALTESMIIAKERSHYQTFPGSPLSQGKFQFDLWNLNRFELSGMWDWDELMNEIKIHGVANSLVTACMPTASTAQIMNNNEAFEPYTENIYTRTTLAGDYYIINKHLMKDLMDLGLWNSEIIDLIKYYEGSIANISYIPDEIKRIYRTVWEIPQQSIIEMAADRGPFIDQTQSMNIFIAKPDFIKLNSCLFTAWKKGLKTGMYYLRSKAVSEANKFGIDIDKIKKIQANKPRIPGECLMCSA
jgi:ribonucleotide reductase alpha subunit